MILLFSGIDILGALDTGDGVANRSTFTRWVDQYMAPQTNFGCSSLELYSARCGLIHARSPQTTLTKKGKAREVVFFATPVFPGQSDQLGPLAVHNGMLWVAFRDGAGQFEADVRRDKAKAKRVEGNLQNVYFTRSK